MYQLIGRKTGTKTWYEYSKKFRTKANALKAVKKIRKISKKLVKEGKAKRKDVTIFKARKIPSKTKKVSDKK